MAKSRKKKESYSQENPDGSVSLVIPDATIDDIETTSRFYEKDGRWWERLDGNTIVSAPNPNLRRKK